MHRRLPFPLVGLAAIGAVFVALPVVALVVRAPWGDLGEALGGVGAGSAFRLSVVVSVAATALSVTFGVPLAWVLARGSFPGRSVLRAVVVLPLVLPPVVGGLGLLFALGRSGIVGRWLYETLGIQLTFTTWGAIVAATFVSMPLVVIATEAGLRSIDPRYELAAATLGARPSRAMWRVVMPMLAPQVAAGAVLAWARALGEFGATITFAGNLAGETQTLPLAVYQARQTDPGGAIFLSLILVVISIVVLVSMRRPPDGRPLTWVCEPISPCAGARSTSRSYSRPPMARRSRCRSQRGRQDHRPGGARRTPARGRRSGRARRRPGRGHAPRSPTGRRLLPGRPALPDDVRARERRLRTQVARERCAGGAGAGGGVAARPRPGRRAERATDGRCRAESGGGWRSRAPWRPRRGCCSSTNRSPGSTSRPVPRSATCSGGSSRASTAWPSSSCTTRWTR